MSWKTAFAVLLLLALVCCGRAEKQVYAPPVDRSARAYSWLEERETDHAAIDEALANRDFNAAAKRIEGALAEPPPLDLPPNAVRVVRQDLYYRKAEILLMRSDPAQALAAVDKGLSLGKEDDLFTANLFIARGRAHEALEDKQQAARDFHEALKINEVLLSEALDEGPN